MTKGTEALPVSIVVVVTMSPDAVHCSLNLPQASQVAPNDKELRVGTRNNPTQSFGANAEPMLVMWWPLVGFAPAT
jgi:hypothetical protein